MKELKIRDAGRNFSLVTQEVDENGKVSITRYGKPAYVVLSAEEYGKFAGEKWQIREKLNKGIWLKDREDAICKVQVYDDFLRIFKETPQDELGDAGATMYKYPIRKVEIFERGGNITIETDGIPREKISTYQYSAEGDMYIFVKELEAVKKSKKPLRRGNIKIIL